MGQEYIFNCLKYINSNKKSYQNYIKLVSVQSVYLQNDIVANYHLTLNVLIKYNEMALKMIKELSIFHQNICFNINAKQKKKHL